jgi:protein-disulfide isomerase
VLLRIAQSAGMDEAQFTACVTDEKALKALNTRVEKYSKDAKITGTPTFIINGKKVGGDDGGEVAWPSWTPPSPKRPRRPRNDPRPARADRFRGHSRGNIAVGPTIARAAAAYPADGDMVLGSARPVQVVVYASLSCTHCAHWNNEVLPVFKKTFIDTGKVRYVFREFLTEPPSFAAAGYLLARRRVPARKYFEVLDGLQAQQAEIYQSEDLWAAC